MARKIAFRKKRQNRLGMLLVSIVVAMLLVVIMISMAGLKKKQNSYIEREEAILSLIDDEEKRAEKLAEYEIYTKTSKYVEEVAKERLGLVYGDEIIFESEDGE
ncbi:MAG: septum formation initiator family protein [Lachnospiraceae bacterium]|nr:septum formation initiator family protein [Lachnospiraceae bacterium]